MAKEFQLVAGHVALDLANTLDYRYDPQRLIDLLPTYESFLAFAAQSGIITPRQAHKLISETAPADRARAFRQAVKLRETLHRLFQSIATSHAPNRSCLKEFNRFLLQGGIPEAISWHNDEFIRGYRDLAETAFAPLWPIVDAAANLLTSPDRHHIRECSEQSCRWLFLDHSKNHSRRWCDMKICGNRSKAQRFRARQKEAE